MMKMRRWAVIKWAARASSEQGATSMTEVKEQYDYLDNIEEQFYYLDNTLKTSLHSETIQYHPKPFISISDVSSLNKPSTEMLKCADRYSTVVLAKNKSLKKGRGAGGSVADALNDMMGGSSEKGAVKVDIVIVMVDAHCGDGYYCDIIILSKLISIAMMMMEGNWNLIRG